MFVKLLVPVTRMLLIWYTLGNRDKFNVPVNAVPFSTKFMRPLFKGGSVPPYVRYRNARLFSRPKPRRVLSVKVRNVSERDKDVRLVGSVPRLPSARQPAISQLSKKGGSSNMLIFQPKRFVFFSAAQCKIKSFRDFKFRKIAVTTISLFLDVPLNEIRRCSKAGFERKTRGLIVTLTPSPILSSVTFDEIFGNIPEHFVWCISKI